MSIFVNPQYNGIKVFLLGLLILGIGYFIVREYRSGFSNVAQVIDNDDTALATVSGTSTTISNLSPGTYTFAVVAQDASGNTSAGSDTITVTIAQVQNSSSGGGGGGGSSKDECEDGKDNDNDDLEDYPDDPGCEDEDDDNETDEEGIGGTPDDIDDTPVPPANTPDGNTPDTSSGITYCAPYLTSYIQYGAQNNTDDVKRLETFLNTHEGESVAVDGIYGLGDVEAVKRFQTKYAFSVLSIWGLSQPTGYVYITTRNKINAFQCAQSVSCPVFTEFNSLTINTISDEVLEAKYALSNLGFAVGTFSTTFDYTFHTAMIDFQETFHEVMLDPWGITEGTGYKYLTTNKYLNELFGCPTGSLTIDGNILQY